MGTVTSLDEYRKKKALESQLRPMTHKEWDNYLLSTSAARSRCVDLVKQIIDFALIKNYHHYRFSHAFERCKLRIELNELIREHNFFEFLEWA